ncbi:hypothetical protein ACS0TY_033350 [Phlomoides rotata]
MVRVWKDHWLHDGNNPYIVRREWVLGSDMLVPGLLDVEVGRWRLSVLESLFYPPTVERILSLQVGLSGRLDVLSWRFTRSRI